MKKIRLGVSPIDNRIFAGYVDKSGKYWEEKQDVTIEALMCVIKHCLEFGEPVVISNDDEPEFEIYIKDLRK